MASKEEIKIAFINELKNTPEYTDTIAIKQLILNNIAIPNIQQNIKYEFSSPKNEEQLSILSMCMIFEFGFASQSVTSSYIVIEMKNFLE